MGQRRVKLETLDSLIHYSLALYLGVPIIIIALYFILGQFGLFGISRQIDGAIITIPAIILVPLSLITYLIQREKLKYHFIKAAVDKDSFKTLVKDIAKELRWTIRSHKNDTFTIKTNPGFVNQSWGQHVTLRLVIFILLLGGVYLNRGIYKRLNSRFVSIPVAIVLTWVSLKLIEHWNWVYGYAKDSGYYWFDERSQTERISEFTMTNWILAILVPLTLLTILTTGYKIVRPKIAK